MGSSGGGSQTVTNKTEVDPTTQAWRNTILRAGQSLYNEGYPGYYPGQSVVPFADQTQIGLGMLENQAMGGVPNMGSANDAIGRALSGNNPASGYAQGFASGQSPFVTGVQQAGGQQTTAGVGTLQGIAGGNSNPALRGLFDSGAEQIRNAVNSNFMAAGRSGPSNAAHTGAMTRELGNLWNQVYMPAWENDQARQMSAASQLAGIQQNDFARNLQGQATAGQMGLQGAGLFGDMHSQGNMDAARAAAMMPGLFDLGGAPARQMMGVGGAWEGLAGEYLQDSMARHQYPYDASWNHLNNFSSLMSGLPQMTTGTQTGPGQQSNRALSAMGGAATGAGIASALTSAGAINSWNPWGWALMGGGALAGMFA